MRWRVDGRAETTALAGGEWAWTYHVDLLEPRTIQRAKVTFAKAGYPTKFDIRVSADGKAWQTVASVDNHGGKPYACEFAATKAQFVRVCSIKPDEPNQKGTQMAVGELEVYEN